MNVEICSATSPNAVWSEYIRLRRPCIFQKLPEDLDSLQGLVTRENLAKYSGDEIVSVESRSEEGRAFGNGRKVQLTVADVLRRIHQGSEELYLSTQDAATQPDGFPALLTPPLRRLAEHGLPLKPAVMGNLIPQAINLWMGRSAAGASSGLHHDFHDNLYVLLRGTKQFRLFPPGMAARMYTHGTLDRIHPNGRIVYKGSGDVGADGADAADVLRWRLKRQADSAAVAEPTAGAAAGDGPGSGEDGEAMMEAVLEAALEAAGSDSYDGEDQSGSEDGSAEQPVAAPGAGIPAQPEAVTAANAAPDSFSQVCSVEQARGGAGCAVHGVLHFGAVVMSEAEHMQVDMSLPRDELRRRFPDFPGIAAAVEVTLHAGEALFLPASWFHEVTSSSGGGEVAHTAVNYWFHPPDNLDLAAEAGAEQAGRFPYTSEFWGDMWNSRVARCGWAAGLAVPVRSSCGGVQGVGSKRKQPDS